MDFKNWLENNYQKLFPFATEEDPPDFKKINRFKSLDNYLKASSSGGRKTEIAAEKLISLPANSPMIGGGGERILELVPSALVIPSHQFPSGQIRPERHVAFVHLTTKEPINPNQEKYNKPRHRILAYWQGDNNSRFTKERVFDPYEYPIGGVSFVGSYLDTVWIAPDFRGSHPEIGIPSLYKALREFAKKRGIVSLEPDDDLTSKSFRLAQAKYDWNRAKGLT